ncbi:hypothetical protein RIF29_38295 [Crotalaria pallida]|uniref:Endonuclease/exonuclease/phosphatase domain-containing protein n=1 Tax=Crotalaria pallida TaxID=3830 RepID=A0AAN9HPK4_CROPI
MAINRKLLARSEINCCMTHLSFLFASVTCSFFVSIMNVFDDVKIISWNIRGTINKDGRRYVRELVHNHHPDIFIVMETHCLFSSSLNFWQRLGFVHVATVEARGHSGGIWVLSCVGANLSYKVCHSFNQCITFSISRGSSSWVCSAMYDSVAESSPRFHSDHSPLLIRCGGLQIDATDFNRSTLLETKNAQECKVQTLLSFSL